MEGSTILRQSEEKIIDKYMESVGLRVLRFSDREVFENLDGVLEKIWSDA
jgi:very-short-patch-repair endonuclease